MFPRDPEKIIEKIITDIGLDFTDEQKTKLRSDLEIILFDKINKLIKRLSGRDDIPFTDFARMEEIAKTIPEFERQLEFELVSFYEESVQTAKIIQVYKNVKQG